MLGEGQGRAGQGRAGQGRVRALPRPRRVHLGLLRSQGHRPPNFFSSSLMASLASVQVTRHLSHRKGARAQGRKGVPCAPAPALGCPPWARQARQGSGQPYLPHSCPNLPAPHPFLRGRWHRARDSNGSFAFKCFYRPLSALCARLQVILSQVEARSLSAVSKMRVQHIESLQDLASTRHATPRHE